MSSSSGPLRFLVVDDEEDVRAFLTRTVERMGHSAQRACDGVEAIEALAGERFDVLLLDLTMPRMSGEDVMRWLGEHPDRAEGLRVVVVSGWAGVHEVDLRDLGVHAVLPKPVPVDRLRAVLDETDSEPES